MSRAGVWGISIGSISWRHVMGGTGEDSGNIIVFGVGGQPGHEPGREIFVDLWALWGYLRNNRGGMHYWHLLRRPFRAEAGVQGHIKRGVFLLAAMGADLGWTGVLMITIVQ